MTWVAVPGYYECFPGLGAHIHPRTHPFWHKMGRPTKHDPTLRVCIEKACSYLEADR